MKVSTAVIEKAGFQREEEELTVAFYAAHVFEVRGFVVGSEEIASCEGEIENHPFGIAIGPSVNAISNDLLGDDLSEDDEEWTKRRGATGPFALVRIGPTSLHNSVEYHARPDDDGIVTYDAFAHAHLELKELEELILPKVETGLACAFDSDEQSVRFVPIGRVAYGETPDGRTVKDVRFSGQANMYTSRRVGLEVVEGTLREATTMAGQLAHKFGNFYSLGLRDDDPLKSFLYFYLAIEMETHRVFKSIDHGDELKALMDAPARVEGSALRLFSPDSREWTGLMDRFTWCAVCEWRHLSDEDIEQFRRVKSVRNDIVHGRLSQPSGDDVRTAKRIARLLQGTATD